MGFEYYLFNIFVIQIKLLNETGTIKSYVQFYIYMSNIMHSKHLVTSQEKTCTQRFKMLWFDAA